MKGIMNQIKKAGLLCLTGTAFLVSCNKDVQQFAVPVVTPPTGVSLGETISATASDSLYYKIILKSGLLSTINNKATTYTMFVPDNAAVIASFGGTMGSALATIDALPQASAAGIVGYNTCPQSLPSANIPSSFPNLQYPSIVNPAPNVSALFRLTTFPSKRNEGAWLNNIPIKSVDVANGNGIIHHTAVIVAPPTAFLWNKIDLDSNLQLLKAAIVRADADPTAPGALQAALLNIGANLTVFAPDTTAFKNTLSVLSGGQIPTAASNATFAGFLASLPIATVKGIVVYHLLPKRAFSVNLPTTATSVPTLLNGAVPTHPGVALQASFMNVPGFGLIAATATVKGVVNASAASITSKDNNYLNGTLHVINQVLLPQ